MAASLSLQLQAGRLFDITGWVAVVTGGGTGLGLIAADTLIANGAARVYVTGRREEVLRNAAKTHSEGTTGEIIPVTCDATKKEDITKLVAFVRSREKFVNLLINNAGIGGVKIAFQKLTNSEAVSQALFASDMKSWNETLHVNTSAIYFGSAFLPLLVAANGPFPSPGSIINVSSMAGLATQSMGGQFAYNTAKAGTISLTRQLAYEFRRPELGVRVNTLAPGYFPSGMLDGDEFSEDPAEVRAKWGLPVGRPGNAADYAQALLSLVVNEYANGTTLLIDGGWLIDQSQTWT